MVSEQIGRPLVGLASHKSVEIIATHSRRPLVVGPGEAVLKCRGVMVLAIPRGGVAVLAKNCADGGFLRADDGIVAWVTRGKFADHAGAHRVMVAASDERRARRRAERRGMELSKAQSRPGYAIHRGRRDDAAERTRNAVAL